MLLGRDAEHARLRDLLDRARGGASAALVIRGEPGIGKSALLENAVAAADGMTVLRARGVESESELSFAGLADLLGPGGRSARARCRRHSAPRSRVRSRSGRRCPATASRSTPRP